MLLHAVRDRGRFEGTQERDRPPRRRVEPRLRCCPASAAAARSIATPMTTSEAVERKIPTVFVPAGEPLLSLPLINHEHLASNKHQLFLYRMMGREVDSRDHYRLSGPWGKRASLPCFRQVAKRVDPEPPCSNPWRNAAGTCRGLPAKGFACAARQPRRPRRQPGSCSPGDGAARSVSDAARCAPFRREGNQRGTCPPGLPGLSGCEAGSPGRCEPVSLTSALTGAAPADQ